MIEQKSPAIETKTEDHAMTNELPNMPQTSPTDQTGVEDIAIQTEFKGTKKEDDFNLADIGLSQDFKREAGIKKESTSTQIRKPPKNGDFFCISPDPTHRLTVALIEFGNNRIPYIVAKSAQAETVRYWKVKVLVLCQTTDGDFFWWPIKMHNAKGDLDSWNTSALEIVEQYANQFIQIHSNEGLGLYQVTTAENIAPPSWSIDRDALIKKTLKGRVISSTVHEIIRRLRGELL